MKMNDTQSIGVSVIVPIYKSAQFAESLLKNLCGQTLQCIEIICVLDGPDDETECVLKRFETEDKRVHIVVQEHQGAGAARNLGMQYAKGKYLIFLDADDLYSPVFLEKMYLKAEETGAEVTLCSYSERNFRRNETIENLGLDYSLFTQEGAVDPSCVERLLTSFVPEPCSKLFLKELIDRNQFRFMNTQIMNDSFFVTAAITSARRIAVIKEDLLMKRKYINDFSITSNRGKHTGDFTVVKKQLYVWLKKNGKWKRYKNTYIDSYKNGLHYHASFDRNQDFIDGVAKTLSRDKPWKGMSRGELIERLGLDTYELTLIRDDILDEIAVFNDKNNSLRDENLRRVNNKLTAIIDIRNAMKDKYGRDLAKRSNPIAAARWRLHSLGLSGTIQYMKRKRRKGSCLEFEKVICTGYLVLSSHRLAFFIPYCNIDGRVSIEEISIVARFNGYYPYARSGEEGSVYKKLGPGMTPLYGGNAPIRRGEIRHITARVSKGVGLRIEITFNYPIYKSNKGALAENNTPVSVMMSGRIRLE